MERLGINKNRWKVKNFTTILMYSHNSDICIYNIRVRVYFSWIVFPIESAVSTLEIGAHRIPSKHFTPWTRPIAVSNMCILFCCILVSVLSHILSVKKDVKHLVNGLFFCTFVSLECISKIPPPCTLTTSWTSGCYTFATEKKDIVKIVEYSFCNREVNE